MGEDEKNEMREGWTERERGPAMMVDVLLLRLCDGCLFVKGGRRESV